MVHMLTGTYESAEKLPQHMAQNIRALVVSMRQENPQALPTAKSALEILNRYLFPKTMELLEMFGITNTIEPNLGLIKLSTNENLLQYRETHNLTKVLEELQWQNFSIECIDP